MSYEVKPVAPTGTRTCRALVKLASGPCEMRDVTEPTYPDNVYGRLLRDRRVNASWSVRHLARAIGMNPVDLSAVEHGRAVFVDENAWERIIAFIDDQQEKAAADHEPRRSP